MVACDSYTWHGTKYTSSGSYTFDSLNAKGCDSLTTLVLTINKTTTATLSKIVCDSYLWHGTTYTISGNYTFDSLNVKGCDSLTTLNLTVDNFKIDSISTSPVSPVVSGTSMGITLYANTPASSAVWTPVYLFSGSNPAQTINAPDTSFRIYVTGFSANNCMDTASRFIVVNNSEVFIPNAIAPSSSNIKVNSLMVYGASVKTAQMNVYNQWGQLLFHTNDSKYPTGNGWDGTFNGKAQPSGVYVYTVKITYYDNKTETKSGSINLIR